MAKYSGSGWHYQSIRHSNARKYGKAGGTYALPTPQQARAYVQLRRIGATPKQAEKFMRERISKSGYVRKKSFGYAKQVSIIHQHKTKLEKHIEKKIIDTKNHLHKSRLQEILNKLKRIVDPHKIKTFVSEHAWDLKNYGIPSAMFLAVATAPIWTSTPSGTALGMGAIAGIGALGMRHTYTSLKDLE